MQRGREHWYSSNAVAVASRFRDSLSAQCLARQDPRVDGFLHVGTTATTAILWCLAITIAAYLWAMYLYERRPAQ